MANSVFHFQKFSIHQDQCAMKVSTDACVFGAWISQLCSCLQLDQALDIGAGTGVLSLMLAQKIPSIQIHAVELEPQAAYQCRNNVQNSNFASRIQSFEADINHWGNENKYDLILSNPPFFIHDLKNKNEQKKMARHTTSLSYLQLIEAINRNAHIQSRIAIMLPPILMHLFEMQMQDHGWHKNQELYFATNRTKPAHLHCVLFSKIKTEYRTEFLFYKNEKQEDTPEFQQLLGDYYLYLA